MCCKLNEGGGWFPPSFSTVFDHWSVFHCSAAVFPQQEVQTLQINMQKCTHKDANMELHRYTETIPRHAEAFCMCLCMCVPMRVCVCVCVHSCVEKMSPCWHSLAWDLLSKNPYKSYPPPSFLVLLLSSRSFSFRLLFLLSIHSCLFLSFSRDLWFPFHPPWLILSSSSSSLFPLVVPGLFCYFHSFPFLCHPCWFRQQNQRWQKYLYTFFFMRNKT